MSDNKNAFFRITYHKVWNWFIFQRFLAPPRILVTPSHQFPGSPKDAAAVWVEELQEESVKICARETKMFDGVHENIKIVSETTIV